MRYGRKKGWQGYTEYGMDVRKVGKAVQIFR